MPAYPQISIFQQSGHKQPIRLHTRRRGASALWPSQHSRVLPHIFPQLQLSVGFLVLFPVELHRHEDTEEDQDYSTAASNCRCQDADLREGN